MIRGLVFATGAIASSYSIEQSFEAIVDFEHAIDAYEQSSANEGNEAKDRGDKELGRAVTVLPIAVVFNGIYIAMFFRDESHYNRLLTDESSISTGAL